MGGGSFVGIESVYFSLLTSSSVQQSSAYSQLLAYWNGTHASVPSDVGAVVYDGTTNRLSYLAPAALATLYLSGGNNAIISSGSGFATNIEKIADEIVNEPFAEVPTAMPTSADNLHAKVLTASQQTAYATAFGGATALMGGIIEIGGCLATIPLTGGIGCSAAVYIGSALTAAGGAAALYSSNIVASNSTVVSLPGTIPAAVQACTVDGDLTDTFSSTPTTIDDDFGAGQTSPSPTPVPNPIPNPEPGPVEPAPAPAPNPVPNPEPAPVEPVPAPGPEPSGAGNSGVGEGGVGEGGVGEGGVGEGGVGDGDGGGGDCFPAGTPILMSDESWKDIARIQKGDHVLWADHTGSHRGEATIVSVKALCRRAVWRVAMKDGTQFCTTATQPLQIHSSSSPLTVRKLKMGDAIVGLNARLRPMANSIVQIERVPQLQTVYHLQSSGTGKFIFGIGNHPGQRKD